MPKYTSKKVHFLVDNTRKRVYIIDITKKQTQQAKRRNEMRTTFENQYSAAALYDGGWRAEDRDQLISEYDLTAEEADELVEELAAIEANEE